MILDILNSGLSIPAPESDERHMILGEFNDSRVGHSQQYFDCRYITIDFRGELDIDASAEFGFECAIYTASHRIDWRIRSENNSAMITKKVLIQRNVWVCSRAIIYNSLLRTGCVVGIGAVVSNSEVPEYALVEGNPAMIVAFLMPEYKRLNHKIPLKRVDWKTFKV